jgi:hypothetical protein
MGTKKEWFPTIVAYHCTRMMRRPQHSSLPENSFGRGCWPFIRFQCQSRNQYPTEYVEKWLPIRRLCIYLKCYI